MPPRLPRALALTTLIFLAADPARGQGLVLQKGRGREFHNPWCPVVRDAKDVLALTPAQASARRLSAHAACANDPGAEGKAGAPPVFVQVDGSKYYHRADCKKLARNSERQALPAAAKSRWPCPVCRPPIRKTGS